ncbi:hypothetical protein H1C71_041773 [Ictidomys tridecemlineatus]|nr:hypothetical protein H1C71_041773 [Ictidomys tridecemlineatus]KAG3284048.1 hypothetical protein H1C71_041773 [Ictidomys tridecemlineatus]KAG3284049.1 hypothetical protein H1C71_041773 [Ictidomys tridecemlineatus]KAG3284050.1 hypothetical protein H1C71_041773 [Ictidomys tridecemlineatus]
MCPWGSWMALAQEGTLLKASVDVALVRTSFHREVIGDVCFCAYDLDSAHSAEWQGVLTKGSFCGFLQVCGAVCGAGPGVRWVLCGSRVSQCRSWLCQPGH